MKRANKANAAQLATVRHSTTQLAAQLTPQPRVRTVPPYRVTQCMWLCGWRACAVHLDYTLLRLTHASSRAIFSSLIWRFHGNQLTDLSLFHHLRIVRSSTHPTIPCFFLISLLFAVSYSILRRMPATRNSVEIPMAADLVSFYLALRPLLHCRGYHCGSCSWSIRSAAVLADLCWSYSNGFKRLTIWFYWLWLDSCAQCAVERKWWSSRESNRHWRFKPSKERHYASSNRLTIPHLMASECMSMFDLLSSVMARWVCEP